MRNKIQLIGFSISFGVCIAPAIRLLTANDPMGIFPAMIATLSLIGILAICD